MPDVCRSSDGDNHVAVCIDGGDWYHGGIIIVLHFLSLLVALAVKLQTRGTPRERRGIFVIVPVPSSSTSSVARLNCRCSWPRNNISLVLIDTNKNVIDTVWLCPRG